MPTIPVIREIIKENGDQTFNVNGEPNMIKCNCGKWIKYDMKNYTMPGFFQCQDCYEDMGK